MFVEMMTGCGRSQQVDLSSELRHVACQDDDFSNCFLVLVKGAHCPNAVKVTDFVEPLLQHWQVICSSSVRNRAFVVGNNNYHSAQLSKDSCGCYTNFGGQQHKSIPWDTGVPAMSSDIGKGFQELLQGMMESNLRKMGFPDQDELPWWRHGSWHAVLNRYHIEQGHCIDFHVDKDDTYDTRKDPIASFSAGVSWPLILKSKTLPARSYNVPVYMVYQHPGDILFMGGAFQQKLLHHVPSLQEWINITPDGQLHHLRVQLKKEWSYVLQGAYENSQPRMRDDRQVWLQRRAQTPQGQPMTGIRRNVTLRWHRTHKKEKCPYKIREKMEQPMWLTNQTSLVKERTQFFESKMANMDAVQEVFQPVMVLREEWEGQHSKSRDPLEDLAAKKRADNQQARASHEIENVPGTPRSPMHGDAESAHPSQHAEAESREDEVRASSQHAEAESSENEVRAQKKQRVTEEVRNKLLESDKMMLEKVTDKINTMVSALMKGFDSASMKLDYATSVLAPYDETHLQILVDATNNRLQNLYAVRQCLMGMFEWVDEPMQRAVTKYCERYEGFLEHRLRLLKTCFVGMGPWPIESRSGMHAEKVPASYKFSEKWTILTREVIQWLEKADFLQWLYDGVQYHILLAPPAGAHIHCEWEYDAQWHEKKGKHYDRNKRDHHLRGGERFVFHAIVFGEYVKHRCSTKVQGIQDYLKEAAKKGTDTHGVDFLKEVKHWMSEACLQEIHLSESEDVTLEIFAQSEDYHMKHMERRQRRRG